MSLANLQEHKEALRARLLADEKVRGRIAFRAFEIYQRHGDGHGGALDNWLQAEDEVVSSLIEQEFQPGAGQALEEFLAAAGANDDGW